VCPREQSVSSGLPEQEMPGVRVLIADDDRTIRNLYTALLADIPGISSVVEAPDGQVAVLTARRLQCEIAILDLNMPRLDGVHAALRLRRDRPSTRIAVHSSDPYGLQERAAGRGLALFDKLDFDGLLAWIERQIRDLPLREPKTAAEALASDPLRGLLQRGRMRQRRSAPEPCRCDPLRAEDDATFERQDRGDPEERDKTHGLPIGDDEDKRARWAPALGYPLDASEISLRGVDSVADRLPQVGGGD
jgi:CheY-like chemotaxis protein